MEENQQFLLDISTHRGRVKILLFILTLVELLLTLTVPLPVFTLRKSELVISLCISLLYQFVFWKVLAPRLKHPWAMLAGAIPLVILFASVAYFSEGLLMATALVLPITTIVAYQTPQVLTLTIVQLTTITSLFFLDVARHPINEIELRSTVLLYLAVLITGFIAAMTSFEIAEKEERMVHLEEMNRIKNTFLSLVSHHLRTPLTILTGYTETVEQTKESLPETVRASLKTLSSQTKKLGNLVENILRITEFQSGEKRLSLQHISVFNVIQNVSERKRKNAEKKGLTVITPSESSKEMTVPADPKQLGIIIENLIDNAIKFTEKGTITIQLEKRAHGVLLSVTDTGKGIPHAFQKELFTLFSRPGDVFQYDEQGVGLGLFMTKLIVDALHGTIWTEDNKPQGTKFCVFLPDFS